MPPATERALAGAHAMARQRDGRLLVLIETDEGGQPLSALAGGRFLFGLKPREPSFDRELPFNEVFRNRGKFAD